MASKFERISALSLETTQHLTETPESWMRFLRSAAWLYKYSFPDQVLISAQRPDATACASLELWNTVFNRWVNRGAKGIALIDDSGDRPHLRHVFDVSDTNNRYDEPFSLWQAKPEYTLRIIEELEDTFVISDAEIDNELCRGTGFEHGKYRVYKFYQEFHTTDEAIKFLKKEWGIGGHSHTYLNGSEGFVDHDAKGISFADYKIETKRLVSWKTVDAHLRVLIASDRYLTDKEKDGLPAYEQEEAEREARWAEEQRNREELQAAARRMDEVRQTATYNLSLGETVYLGAQAYEIVAYDDQSVTLFNPKYPLFSEEMDRETFDRRMRENPQNDHLIRSNESDADVNPEDLEVIDEESETDFAFRPYAEGDTVYLDGTAFQITGLSDREVELLDPTLLYPIFRVESREQFERLLKADERNAPFFRVEPESEPADEVKLHSIVIDLRPSWEREPKKPMPIPIVNGNGARHNFHIEDDHLGEGGAKTKFRRNMNAIHLLKIIEDDHRLATPEEQETLSQYVGWGGLPQAFDAENEQWKDEYAELKAALTEDEYNSARGSVLNAHYTSPTVIRAIYQAIANMGFKTGKPHYLYSSEISPYHAAALQHCSAGSAHAGYD